MTMATDENRLGVVELRGRLTEQSSALQELRAGLRETNARIDRFLACFWQ